MWLWIIFGTIKCMLCYVRNRAKSMVSSSSCAMSKIQVTPTVPEPPCGVLWCDLEVDATELWHTTGATPNVGSNTCQERLGCLLQDLSVTTFVSKCVAVHTSNTRRILNPAWKPAAFDFSQSICEVFEWDQCWQWLPTFFSHLFLIIKHNRIHRQNSSTNGLVLKIFYVWHLKILQW